MYRWIENLLNLTATREQVLQFFLLSTILLGLLVLCLLYSNIALLIYHQPTSSHPLDMALIHAPLRFFLILPLSILFPYSLL
jgi:hypothetical protein